MSKHHVGNIMFVETSSIKKLATVIVGLFSLEKRGLKLYDTFLVGAFPVKRARLLQWLDFSFFFDRPHRVCTTF